MRGLVRATVFGLVTWSVAGFAADAAGAPKKYRRDRTPDYQVAVHVTFSTRDVHLIRTHYASRYRSLPPGLQKKLRRTGQLPPGWQKKFEPFPPVLERELVVLPRGYSRGVIDGHAVIIDPHTHVIVDLAVLF